MIKIVKLLLQDRFELIPQQAEREREKKNWQFAVTNIHVVSTEAGDVVLLAMLNEAQRQYCCFLKHLDAVNP